MAGTTSAESRTGASSTRTRRLRTTPRPDAPPRARAASCRYPPLRSGRSAAPRAGRARAELLQLALTPHERIRRHRQSQPRPRRPTGSTRARGPAGESVAAAREAQGRARARARRASGHANARSGPAPPSGARSDTARAAPALHALAGRILLRERQRLAQHVNVRPKASWASSRASSAASFRSSNRSLSARKNSSYASSPYARPRQSASARSASDVARAALRSAFRAASHSESSRSNRVASRRSRLELQRVRAAARDDRHPVGQGLAQLRDVHLHQAPGRSGRGIAPHRLDEIVDVATRARPPRRGRPGAASAWRRGERGRRRSPRPRGTEHAYFFPQPSRSFSTVFQSRG